MSAKYYLRTKKTDFREIAEQLDVDPVLVRLMYNRDVPTDEMDQFLHPSLRDLHDAHLLPGVEKGAAILADQIRQGASVRIIGDYDVDGICSTYILLRGLQKIGADADYRIPDRKRHGYGLHPELIDLAHKDGRQVLLTCDNGISEVSSIARAKAYGMTVIVTDHHNIPDLLPQADALIDPKLKDPHGECTYPYTEICGAVVAWKFLTVLYEFMGEPEKELEQYLQFAAFATVCDVMPLRDENRAIVKYGLSAIRNSSNPGLAALAEANGIEVTKAWHFGFTLGPCINAAGRLETAEEAMQLLLADSPQKAEKKARHLKELNDERKILTEKGIRDAIDRISIHKYQEDKVLVIHLPDCPDSIAGIVAGKVREKLYRPVLIAAGTGEILKGSGRSIPGYSLFDEMQNVSHLFEKFGGHPLAAGFSIRSDHISELRRQLNALCRLSDEQLVEKKYIDVDMPMSYVSIRLLRELELLEPYGTQNEAPVFAANHPTLVHAGWIGKGRFLQFRVREENTDFTARAVYFGDPQAFLDAYEERFGPEEKDRLLRGNGRMTLSFIYRPEANTWNGRTGISFQIREFIF